MLFCSLLSPFESNGHCGVSPVITRGRKKKRRTSATNIRTWSGSFNPQNRVTIELKSYSLYFTDSFVPFTLAHSSLSWVSTSTQSEERGRKLENCLFGFLQNKKHSYFFSDQIGC